MIRRLAGVGPRWLAWTVLVVAGLLFMGSAAFAAWGAGRPSLPTGGTGPQGPAQVRPTTGSSSPAGGTLPQGSRQVGPTAGASGPGWAGGGPGGMMGNGRTGGMMGGRVWLPGDGVRVATIAQARARATMAAASSGLRPGEVMQFSENFYVELKDASGAATSEVLVDPSTGAVATENGPAMMWNTGNRTAAVSADQAVAIANRWLQANMAGQTAGMPEAYPGYYTIDTTSGGGKVGMMSVNAATGAVWYHTWHGQFIAEEDA